MAKDDLRKPKKKWRPAAPSLTTPTDIDILTLCAMLLPEIHNIVQKRHIPRDSIIRQMLSGAICSNGMVQVIRSLDFKTCAAQPADMKPNKLTDAFMKHYNSLLEKEQVIDMHKPVDSPNLPTRRLRKIVLSPGRVVLLKHHETSDLPYVVQGDAFPQKIWANEDILMKGCPFIRTAYTTKCLGNFEDSDDDAIYDPNTTRMEAKKCLREAKMVYLPNLIASSYRSIEKPYHFPGDLSVVESWHNDKLWKDTSLRNVSRTAKHVKRFENRGASISSHNITG